VVKYGEYLKSLPEMPKPYESCFDKVIAKTKANLDFKLNPLKKEPSHLQHTCTTAN